MFYYSIFMFLVYPVGIPLFFFYLQDRYKDHVYPGNRDKVLKVRHDYTTSEDAARQRDPYTARQSVIEVNSTNMTPNDHRMLRQHVLTLIAKLNHLTFQAPTCGREWTPLDTTVLPMRRQLEQGVVLRGPDPLCVQMRREAKEREEKLLEEAREAAAKKRAKPNKLRAVITAVKSIRRGRKVAADPST